MANPFDPTDAALAALAPSGHLGACALRDAYRLVAAGNFDAALEHLDQARRIGLPAELAPHAGVVAGLAYARAGRFDEAVTAVESAWANHPDFAALPALLGLVRTAAGTHEAAAHAFTASLAGEDPDGSLALHGRELARYAAKLVG